MEKIMTMREFLNGVVAIEGADETIIAFANEQLKKLDSKNSSRATKKAEEKAKEYAPLREAFVGALQTSNGLLTSEIAVALGVNSSKVSAIAKTLIEDGTIKAEKVKIAKVGERVKYALA